MDKKTRMRWKGLHFLSSRQNEISTEALSSEKQGLSAGGHFEDPLLAERQLGHPERNKDPEEADSLQHQWVI